MLTSPGSKSQHDRRYWDGRYRDGLREQPPAALLRRWLPRLTPGRALDVACGAGRNALLLAAHGWRVVGVDISSVGLHLAQAAARERGLALDLAAVDLERWPLPSGCFDLVCVFRYLDRGLCPRLAAALRPGGTLIYETFTVAQRDYEGGPRTADRLLQPGELPRLFAALEPLEFVEGIVAEGGRPRALARYVGRRPAALAAPAAR
jgi:SAM-dependent methyltransferase